jgi:hypothetical protein
MANDQFIQVPADSVGKRVEVTEVLRVDGILVERQRMEVPDLIRLLEISAEMLAEMRLTNLMLARALDMGSDELLDLRSDNLN